MGHRFSSTCEPLQRRSKPLKLHTVFSMHVTGWDYNCQTRVGRVRVWKALIHADAHSFAAPTLAPTNLPAGHVHIPRELRVVPAL